MEEGLPRTAQLLLRQRASSSSALGALNAALPHCTSFTEVYILCCTHIDVYITFRLIQTRLYQCGLICGAIEESTRSLKAIDERVLINFRDTNAIFTNFRDKNAVFTHFRDKNAVFTNFCDKNAEFTCDKNLFCR